MSYQLIENDVRLLRRILIAYQLGDEPSAKTITNYLRGKGFRFLLPSEQTDEDKVRSTARLLDNEKWLATRYGFAIMIDYAREAVFLNSKWRNPYTLYVRLVEPVPELGTLGEKYWVPAQLGLEEEFRAQAEEAHKKYGEQRPLPAGPVAPSVVLPKPWYKRLFD